MDVSRLEKKHVSQHPGLEKTVEINLHLQSLLVLSLLQYIAGFGVFNILNLILLL